MVPCHAQIASSSAIINTTPMRRAVSSIICKIEMFAPMTSRRRQADFTISPSRITASAAAGSAFMTMRHTGQPPSFLLATTPTLLFAISPFVDADTPSYLLFARDEVADAEAPMPCGISCLLCRHAGCFAALRPIRHARSATERRLSSPSPRLFIITADAAAGLREEARRPILPFLAADYYVSLTLRGELPKIVDDASPAAFDAASIWMARAPFSGVAAAIARCARSRSRR